MKRWEIILNYLLTTSWIKTIWFNFKYLPLKQAKILPIVIARHTKIKSYGRAKVEISINEEEAGKITLGMIKLGYANMPTQNVKSDPLGICFTDGTHLVFKGRGRISAGSQIYLRGGSIEIGDDFHISMNVKIYSSSSITVGAHTTIGWNSQIVDTDFHTIKNVNTGQVYPQCKNIVIGDHCWICNSCSIMKGTVIPDYVIVGSRSVCNKQYDVPKYSVIAGTPAVLKKEGMAYEY